MSTPVCIANAVADALDLADLDLPLSPSRIATHIYGEERPPKHPVTEAAPAPGASGERKLTGQGEARVAAPREAIWGMLLDPSTLKAVVPGAHDVRKISDTHFAADVTLGIGPVKGRYRAEIRLSDLEPPAAVTLAGTAAGALGSGGGRGRVTLVEEGPATTLIRYRYEAAIGGKVASVGGRLLDGAARVVIGQFFQALARHAGGDAAAQAGFFRRLLDRIRSLKTRRA